MSPLASVMLLAFLFLIVTALVIWLLLLPRPEAPEEPPALEPPKPSTPVTNDDVRGARAKREDHEDAFERFLRAGRDEDRG